MWNKVEETEGSRLYRLYVGEPGHPEWRRVNTFSPGSKVSPHYAYHGAFALMNDLMNNLIEGTRLHGLGKEEMKKHIAGFFTGLQQGSSDHEVRDNMIFLRKTGYSHFPNEEQGGSDEEPEGPLEWVDEITGKVIFTVQDIKRFDWEKQVFEMKTPLMDKIKACLPENEHFGQHRGFIVRDGKGTIYKGDFYSPVSSLYLFLPSICIQACFTGQPQPPFYLIENRCRKTEDMKSSPMFSERIRKALEKAGVLVIIPEEEIEKVPR